ncbi:GntR family transcriptional regulator [Azospirillum brasilense]|uniref:GntR family transcriptional regulator n=1 Tax=Azospirillum brasilense TaxID=192 RepID=UPI001ED9F73C|nr:GntR family transcriptional regulator [Azospirillum brasilense]UKJ76588.1 GntR family transcriptional regulator [Azospirillum brasilense]
MADSAGALAPQWDNGLGGGSNRAADRAYRFIREGILASRWPPGAHLREQELAELTGVSRTPVREALRRLSADGLLQLVPNLGAKVNAWTIQDLDEIFGLRATLESQVAGLAASRAEPHHLVDLGALCDAMEAVVGDGHAVDFSRITPLNDRFHGLLIDIAGDRRLGQMIRQVVEMPLVLRTFARYSRRDLARSMNHHREIVEALTARDGEWASSVMRAHVRAGRAVFTVPKTE